jgi:hypothetical protein
MEVVAKRTIPCLCRESNPDSSAVMYCYTKLYANRITLENNEACSTFSDSTDEYYYHGEESCSKAGSSNS